MSTGKAGATRPSGIGDEAFVEHQPQQGTVLVTVRLGDTILQTKISGPQNTPLALASDADRAWLEGIARTMAANFGEAAAAQR